MVPRVVVSSRRLRPGSRPVIRNYMGTELFGIVTWRFAPGLSWSNGAGYMFTGDGFDAYTLATGPRSAKDIFIMTSRLRFTF